MISLRSTRYWYGITIMLTHFATMGVFFILGSRFMPNEFIEVLQGVLMLAPVAGIYVATFLRYVAANPTVNRQEAEQKLGYGPFFVQYLVIFLFCGALFGGTGFLFIDGTILPYDDIKAFTGAVDSVFAVYLGIIFGKLFPMEWEVHAPAPPAHARNGEGD